MDDYTIITINGSDYYVPSNLVQYINEDGVSNYNSNFYAYKSINTSNNTNYPRLTFRPQAYPVYQGSSTGTATVLTNNTVTFSAHAQLLRSQYYFPFIEIFLLGAIFIALWFRRFSR